MKSKGGASLQRFHLWVGRWVVESAGPPQNSRLRDKHHETIVPV